MNAESDVRELKGIGDKTAGALKKLHIQTVGDLISFYPREYDRLEEISAIAGLIPGVKSIVRAGIVGTAVEKKIRTLSITTCYAADTTGRICLTFFNMPFIRHTLKPGMICLLRGKVSYRGTTPVMEQPVILTLEEYEKLKAHLQPVYPLTEKVTQKTLRKAVAQALPALEMQEFLPQEILQAHHLMEYQEAAYAVHFPDDETQLIKAHKRMAFDEFLMFLLGIRQLKQTSEHAANAFPMLEVADTQRLQEALPYRLTPDQEEVWHQMQADLTGPYTMNRLIQGDVGSGKTILAVLALLMTAANGYQGALMAPTEILALQHFEAIRELSRKNHLPLVPVLLTGSLTVKEKKQVYTLIETGTVNCIIGTHALIQEKVHYQKLALVITDEQHRFGVAQREALMQKGKTPHVCVMSATPIPRSLAMILYGDLSISAIHHLPSERMPIKNAVVDISYRPNAYAFLKKEATAGRQAYVICPMIEESEDSDLENVETYTEKLKAALPPQIQIAMLHGKMRPADKNRIMGAFAAGEIDILVSTTVVEVGMNVPNATVMMIENAERFGLAQLHQLRGRVGRGSWQSYCIFVNTSQKEEAKQRLMVLERSNDGFEIAEEDLKLRGPGDLFGIRQSGEMSFHLADIYQDADVLQEADLVCRQITAQENWEKDDRYALLASHLESTLRNAIDFPSI